MFINVSKPLIIKNCILFKAPHKKTFHLSRVICQSHQHSIDTYTFIITEEDKSSIQKFEQYVRKGLGLNMFLNTQVGQNIITCKIPKVKGKVQSIKNNSISNDDNCEKDKIANIEIYVDNMYSFTNNRRNIYYKLKLKSIEFIS